MRAITGVLVLLVALSGAVQASFIEDTTGVYYQNDGDTGQDAPDACDGEPGPRFGQDAPQGQLVPIDDPVDQWVLPMADSRAGGTFALTVENQGVVADPGPGEQLETELATSSIVVLVYGPGGCGGELLGEGVALPGGQAEVVFTTDSSADHRIELQLAEDGSEVLDGSAERHQHCAPACLASYDMTIALA